MVFSGTHQQSFADASLLLARLLCQKLHKQNLDAPAKFQLRQKNH
jgi:hypothetical protein